MKYKYIWGCSGFDRMIGLIRLRVRALFSVINEQTKLNATDNVVTPKAWGRTASAIAA